MSAHYDDHQIPQCTRISILAVEGHATIPKVIMSVSVISDEEETARVTKVVNPYCPDLQSQ